MATLVSRPQRADARRNRDAILTAARAIFDAEGIYASIDGIATTAGVGNATLYRNFPTRDDLLAAVIEDVVGDLLTESVDFERDLAPDAALREWLFRLAWQLRTWSGLPTCIASAIDDATSPVQPVPIRLSNRTQDFLSRAQGDGTASRSVTHEELFELITALAWGIDRFGDDPKRARDRVALATVGVFTNA